jgi:hypothetical protein
MKRPPRKAAFSFTEPISLSSTPPGNLPLAGTAPASRFDLLALRARCKSQPRGRGGPAQEARRTTGCNLRTFLFARTNWRNLQDAQKRKGHPERRPFHSPSRSRFRPRSPGTFPLRVPPPRVASIYSRSVLGARGTVDRRCGPCKAPADDLARKLRCLPFALVEWGFFQRATAARGGLEAGMPGKKFAEPEALSSAFPGDLPLPRTASREGFDLPALRARRTRQSRSPAMADQDLSAPKRVLFAGFRLSTFPHWSFTAAGLSCGQGGDVSRRARTPT